MDNISNKVVRIISQKIDFDWNTPFKLNSIRSSIGSGFFIDLNDNRKKIYKSTQFKDWIKSYNMTNIPYEFPIGYVESDQFKEFSLRYKDSFIFDRVEFI